MPKHGAPLLCGVRDRLQASVWTRRKTFVPSSKRLTLADVSNLATPVVPVAPARKAQPVAQSIERSTSVRKTGVCSGARSGAETFIPEQAVAVCGLCVGLTSANSMRQTAERLNRPATTWVSENPFQCCSATPRLNAWTVASVWPFRTALSGRSEATDGPEYRPSVTKTVSMLENQPHSTKESGTNASC